MRARNALANAATIENQLISNYVQLCIAEGIKPRDAYKEIERRLKAFKKLKNPKTPQQNH